MTKAFSLRLRVAGAALMLLAGLVPSAAEAASLSFVGNISRDDEVKLFAFTIEASSNVIFKTLSWAGGTNANNVSIAAGGFDPSLAVFSADGTRIGTSSDATSSQILALDSGLRFDDYLQIGSLAAGNYTVAISQSGNNPGLTLAAPFSQQGNSNYSSELNGCETSIFFCASQGLARDSRFAFDILGIEVAGNPTDGNGNGNGNGNSDVPIPAAFFLFGGALAGFGGLSRMKRKKA